MEKIIANILYCTIVMCFVVACQKTLTLKSIPMDTVNTTSIKTDAFGSLPNNQIVKRYTLVNQNGLQMQVINYGGIITSLLVPDKNGNLEDVVLGYDLLSDYLKESSYFGALIGRYGNRIGNGKFKLDDKVYNLAQNNNGQHLHGGVRGFDKVFWNIEEIEREEGSALKLNYFSKDGEEGYPGNLSVEVLYVLTNSNELKIEYKATTDKKTIVNLTQHSYFNLTGNCKRDILNHDLILVADKFIPIDKVLIPIGTLKEVKNTPFDFRTEKKIGAQINDKDQQLEFGLGYDHCWVLSSSDSMKLAASLYEFTSGRLMEVYTTEPGIQFYSGNFLDGTLIGKGDVNYKFRNGLCLETQHFPDAPNKPQFPSVVLNPGEVYHTKTTYAFSIK